MNRCFDNIERFVLRIQSAAIAQKELEQHVQRYRTAQRRKNGLNAAVASPPGSGILQRQAEIPGEFEFVDILQKFKLLFNLLPKLRNHIHEPTAAELVHFIFKPLMIILDAGQWGVGRNIASEVYSPLISSEAHELMHNCLTRRELDVWKSLGDAWRVPPQEWVGPLPKPFQPIFIDGFAPYGSLKIDDAPAPPFAEHTCTRTPGKKALFYEEHHATKSLNVPMDPKPYTTAERNEKHDEALAIDEYLLKALEGINEATEDTSDTADDDTPLEAFERNEEKHVTRF